MDPYHEERLRNEVIYLHSLYDEERLTNEVLYLHSLWHQGPPNPRPLHIPYNPRPYSLIHQSSVNLNPRPPYPFVPNHPRPLQPVHSSSFKNKKRKKKKPTKKRDGKKRTRVDPHLNSGSEWPMPTQDSAPAVSGWPPLEPRPAQVTPPLSAEDKEKLQALQVQYKARQACREFLFDYNDSDDEADEDGFEDDEDSLDDDDDEAEEIGELFSKLFGENNELRNYYQKCWESGEFRCLVCGLADNKNAGKRFHDCVGLVQHSMSISRTKNRRAHRAFGNAVCNVLGWDIKRLPTIVIKNGVKPAEAEGKTIDNAAEGKDGSLSPDKLDEASVEQLGGPVKHDVEVVHETIKRVSEMLAPTQNAAPVDSKWPPLEPPPTQATRPLSAEEKEILEVLQVQYKARRACQEFLSSSGYSDNGSDDNEEEEEDDMDNDEELEEMIDFFLKLFGENNELRKYYEKCWERGEFRCLVCGVADNKNVGKRFLDCVSLVQHSMSISRTKNRRAHRAFGNAVCNVLGWDINRLPTIVIKNGVKPAEAEGKTIDNAAEGKDGSLSPDKLDEASVEQLGGPVKHDVEVVHETIKRVSEMLAPTQNAAPVDSKWPPLEPPPTQATRPLSAEEKEILEVLQVQYKARRACQEFLSSSGYSDNGSDDNEEEEEDDMDNDEELEEMIDFFLKLFGENNELRKYYEKCWERGEFRCLVCGVADNKNVGKRFLDCVSLVQHSMSISRTKNRRAHRAFGNAVCNVLGWDINRLPTIVIKKEVKPPETEGKTNVDAANGEEGSLSSCKLDEVSGEQLGEPVKQNVEVVYETIKRVSELLAPTQDSAPEDAAWPPLELCPTQATHPLSAEERETLEVLRVQYKARQACREFLFGSDDSDDGGDDDEEDDMDNDDSDDDDDDDELREMGDFFLKLFGENNELRKYYEKCWEHGEFRCLVCGVADNKNAGKRFHDCVGLVQHSMSISRTKKKRAHRAFGNALCNVLGWDINRLPTIVIKNEEKPAEAKRKTNENDDGKDGSLSSDKLDYKASVERLGEPVKHGVEVVHETIKQVSEGEPDKSADDQVNGASNRNFDEDHDVPQ